MSLSTECAAVLLSFRFYPSIKVSVKENEVPTEKKF